MTGNGKKQGIIVNFTHPINENQLRQIEEGTELHISEIVQPSKVPVHFNETNLLRIKSLDLLMMRSV